MSDQNTRKEIPAARYWRLRLYGPFIKREGLRDITESREVGYLQYGGIVMQSGDTNMRLLRDKLPVPRLDHPLETVRHTGPKMTLVDARSNRGDWAHNDTTRIGKTSAHAIHFEHDHLSETTKGGLLEYEFRYNTRVNEIVFVSTLAPQDVSPVPDKLVISYSTDGASWSTEKVYTFGVNWKARFPNPIGDGVHSSAIVLKRNRLTNEWLDTVVVERIRAGSTDSVKSDEYTERRFANTFAAPQFGCRDFVSSFHATTIDVAEMCGDKSAVVAHDSSPSFEGTLHMSGFLSSGFQEMNYGMSYYTPVWAPLHNALSHVNISLPSAFLYVPDGGCDTSQVIESGPKYMHAHKFKRGGFPKLMMSMTNDCYGSEINAIGFRLSKSADCSDVRFHRLTDDEMSIVQLSNKMLIPPDGLPFGGNPNGELLGTAFMALPLTGNADDPIHSWTLFVNTKNFKGPLAYFLPEKLERVHSSGNHIGLNRKLKQDGAHFGMHIEDTPSFVRGNYAKIPTIRFPLKRGTNKTELVTDVFYYPKDGTYDKVMRFRREVEKAGVKTVKKELDPFFMTDNSHGFKTMLFTSPTAFKYDGTRVTGIEPNIAEKIAMNNAGIFYNWNTLDTGNTGTNEAKYPEYLHRWVDDAWRPIDEFQLKMSQDEDALKSHAFEVDADAGGIYSVLDERGMLTGAWAIPGPSMDQDGRIGPYKVVLTDGSTSVYYWYRFVDQPVFHQIRNTKSEAEWTNLQRLVENLHRNWQAHHNYIPSPSEGGLVEMDPGLIVCPPKGLEFGYVPLVVAQYKRRPDKRDPPCANVSHMRSGMNIPTSATQVTRCADNTYVAVPSEKSCSATGMALVELDTPERCSEARSSLNVSGNVNRLPLFVNDDLAKGCNIFPRRGDTETASFSRNQTGTVPGGTRLCRHIGSVDNYRKRLEYLRAANVVRLKETQKQKQKSKEQELLVRYTTRFETVNTKIVNLVQELEAVELAIEKVQRSMANDKNAISLNASYVREVIDVKNTALQNYVDASSTLLAALSQDTKFDEKRVTEALERIESIQNSIASIIAVAKTLKSRYGDFSIQSLRDRINVQTSESSPLNGIRERLQKIDTEILDGDDVRAIQTKIKNYHDTFEPALKLNANTGYVNQRIALDGAVETFDSARSRIQRYLLEIYDKTKEIDEVQKYVDVQTDARALARMNSTVRRLIDEDITVRENIINRDLATVVRTLTEINSMEGAIVRYIQNKFKSNLTGIASDLQTKADDLKKRLEQVPKILEDMDRIHSDFKHIVITLRKVYTDVSEKLRNTRPEAEAIASVARAKLAKVNTDADAITAFQREVASFDLKGAVNVIELIDRVEAGMIEVNDGYDRVVKHRKDLRDGLIAISHKYYTQMNRDIYALGSFKHNSTIAIRKFKTEVYGKNDKLIGIGFSTRIVDSRHKSYVDSLMKDVQSEQARLETLKRRFNTLEKEFYDTMQRIMAMRATVFMVNNTYKYPVRTDFDLFVSIHDAMYVAEDGGKAVFDRLMAMGEREFEQGTVGRTQIKAVRDFLSVYTEKKLTSTTKSTAGSAFLQMDYFQPKVPVDRLLQKGTVYTNRFVNFHNDPHQRLGVVLDLEIPFALKDLNVLLTQVPKTPAATRNAWFVMQLYNGVLNLSLFDYLLGASEKAIGRFKVGTTPANVTDPSMKESANRAMGDLKGRVRIEFTYGKRDGLVFRVVANGREYTFANMAYKHADGKVRWTSEELYKQYIDTELPKRYNRSRDELLFERSAYELKVFQSNVKLHNIDIKQFSFDNYECPPEPCEGGWSDWSECTKECGGGGERTRKYTITRLQRHGGERCEALDNEVEREECGTDPCPIDCKSAWGDWTRECVDGKQRREFEVRVHPEHGGKECPVEEGKEETRDCPINCEGEFDGWTECSKECGGGMQSDTYRVKRRGNSTALDCPFDDGEVINRACNTHLCEPKDCEGTWSEWEPCDQACETRKKVSRTLNVTVPAKHGGKCVTKETKDCEIKSCPVHCDGAWSDWTVCSEICGGGTRSRTFTIKREAKNNGLECIQPDGKMEVELCNIHQCRPADCSGKWSEWDGECDQPCGQTKTLTREFTVTKAAAFGETCPDPKETYECPVVPCPIPCEGDWTAFGECKIEGDAKCGKGVRTREYKISVQPQHGGKACPIFPNEMYEQACEKCAFEEPTSNDVGTIQPALMDGNAMKGQLQYVMSSHPTKKRNVRLYVSAEIEIPKSTSLGQYRSLVLAISQRVVDGIRPRNGFHFQLYDGGIMLQYYDKDFNENRDGIMELNQLPHGYFSVRSVPALNAMTGRVRMQIMLAESHDFILQFNDYRIDRSNSKMSYGHGRNTMELYKEKMMRYPECTYPKYNVESQLRDLKLHSVYAEQYTSSDVCRGAVKWSPCINKVKCGNVGIRNQYLDGALFQFEDCEMPTLIQNEGCHAAGFRACDAPAIVNDAKFEDDFEPALDQGMVMRRNVQYFSNKMHRTKDPNVILYFECVVELPKNMKFGAEGLALAIDTREPGTDNVAWWRFQMYSGGHMFIFSDKRHNHTTPDLWFGRHDNRNDAALRELTGDVHVKIMYTADYGLSFSINDLDMRYHKHYSNHLVYTMKEGRDIDFTNKGVNLLSQYAGLKVKSLYLEQNTPVSTSSSEYPHKELYDSYVGRNNVIIYGAPARNDTMNLPAHDVMQLCSDTPGCVAVTQRLHDARQYYKKESYARAKHAVMNGEYLGNYVLLKHNNDKQEILDAIPAWSHDTQDIMHRPRYMDEYAANVTYDKVANTIVNSNNYLKTHSRTSLYGGLTHFVFRRERKWDLKEFYDWDKDTSKSQLKNYCALKLGMLDIAKRENRIKSREDYDRMLKETTAMCSDYV